MNFESFFLNHGAASYDKQIYLQAMLGKIGWGFDMNSGVLAFRRPHEAPLQLAVAVLGTESEDTNTWLWAWANDSDLPPTLTASATAAQATGRCAAHPANSHSANIDSRRRSIRSAYVLVASGVLRASAYFRAPYPRGALYSADQGSQIQAQHHATGAARGQSLPTVLVQTLRGRPARGVRALSALLSLAG